MEISDVKYSQYLQILREELLPAMGCTEPIAMAYAAAKQGRPSAQCRIRSTSS